MDWWACAHSSLFQDGVIEVRDLLRTLYETAVAKKQWGIVRHCAGYLGRRVDDLSKVCSHMQAVLIYHHGTRVRFSTGSDRYGCAAKTSDGRDAAVQRSRRLWSGMRSTLSGDVEGKANMF